MKLNSSIKYNFLSVPIRVLSERIISINIFCLLSGYLITTLTGLKIHYLIAVFSSLVLLILNLKPYLNLIKLFYLSTLSLGIIHFLAIKSPDVSFVLSLFTYLLIPVVFFTYQFKTFNLEGIVVCFKVFTLFYFLGLLLQVIGFNSPFLAIDLTYTDGVLHDRYGSLAGGTLALGFTASISSIASFYEIIYERKNSFINFLFLFLSFATLILAQSRRFYIFVIIILLLIYVFDINKQYNYKKIALLIISAVFFLSIVFSILFFFRNDSYYIMRLFSTFDLVNDESNLIRIGKWLTAIDTFLNNLWFGVGLGTTATVGKDLSTTYIDDLFVAESYYLKGFVEGGITFGLTFFLICIKFLLKSFRSFRSPQSALAGFIFLFFFLDNFVSTSLESVSSSIIFWLCLSILSKNNDIAPQIENT